MKLQQLRYIVTVFDHGLNVSMAAKTLRTSQPSMSKQIRQLEDQLGVQIFERHGKHFTKVTPAGKALVQMARKVLTKVDNIEAVAREQTHSEQGILTISAASNQLSYQLPPMLGGFIERYPKVTIQVYQGRPPQIIEAMIKGEVDLITLNEVGSVYEELLLLPCYRWQPIIIMRNDHPLASKKQVSIAELSNYPLASIPFDFFGQPLLEIFFKYSKLVARIVFTAADPELLKSYVRLGLGVAIIGKMAFDPQLDHDLVSFDSCPFLPTFTTKIGFLRSKFLRRYMFDFITHFAPHLTRSVINAAAALPDNQAVDEMFKSFKLPLK